MQVVGQSLHDILQFGQFGPNANRLHVRQCHQYNMCYHTSILSIQTSCYCVCAAPPIAGNTADQISEMASAAVTVQFLTRSPRYTI